MLISIAYGQNKNYIKTCQIVCSTAVDHFEYLFKCNVSSVYKYSLFYIIIIIKQYQYVYSGHFMYMLDIVYCPEIGLPFAFQSLISALYR